MTASEYNAMVNGDVDTLIQRDWFAAAFTREGPDNKAIGVSQLSEDFKTSVKGFATGEGAVALHAGNMSHPGLRLVMLMPLEQAEGLHSMLGRMIETVKAGTKRAVA